MIKGGRSPIACGIRTAQDVARRCDQTLELLKLDDSARASLRMQFSILQFQTPAAPWQRDRYKQQMGG